MSKKGLWVIVLVLAVVLVVLNVLGARRAEVEQVVPTEPEVVSPTPLELTFASSTKTVQHADYGVSFDFPVTNSESVNQEINTFVDQTIASFEKEVLEFGPHLIPGRQYTMYGSFEQYQGSTYTTFVFLVSVDTGGAHPNHTFTTRIFDQYGKRVDITTVLTHLFGDDGTLERVATLAHESLTQQIGNSSSPEWIADGTAPIAENFQDFYVENETLVLLFEPYAVGPYALQSREVRLTREDVVEQTSATTTPSVVE